MTIPTISTINSNGTGHDTLKALQDIIRNAPSITVLCGAGVSTSAGIKDFRSADGLYRQSFTSGRATVRGRELFDIKILNNPETLCILNKVMLNLRIQARGASPTSFHRLVHAFFSLGCLVQCYTQNFDGLQTKDYLDMAGVVYKIHGSNTRLKCRVCQQDAPEPVQQYDQSFADESAVPCPHCLERDAQARGSNKRSRPVGYLAPAILFNQESAAGRDGQDYHKMLEKDGRATKLLLIAGTSLMTPGVACMVRELAGWDRYIDLYLETELDSWAVATLRDISNVRNKGNVKTFEALVAKLKILLQWELESDLQNCGEAVPTQGTSQSADNLSSHPKMPTSPGRTAHLALTRVTANKIAVPIKSTQSDRPTAESMRQNSVHPRPQVQKIITVVLHHAGAAGEADLIGREIMSQLTESRWESAFYVRDVSDMEPVDTPSGLQLFHVVFVHITDCIQQLDAKDRLMSDADDAFEMLVVSRRRLRRLLAPAISCQAILVCSREHLLCAAETSRLEASMRSVFNCDNALVCSNLRSFHVPDWGRFIAKVGPLLLKPRGQSVPQVVKAWMQSPSVFSSSNFVWVSSQYPTLLLLASPFETRPCGRPLPNVELACKCSGSHPCAWRKPKRWIVEHNCEDGTAVKDAVVFVGCSWCGKQWQLPTKTLAGVVCKIDKSFAVVAPYFD
ncbi:hypothetical protein FS749_015425 [Ceratobasidium sp. UAMH 11750]|nr:hypothetical protein FS749_015425 [Ceratobasidium sp. UAMH 11750]